MHQLYSMIITKKRLLRKNNLTKFSSYTLNSANLQFQFTPTTLAKPMTTEAELEIRVTWSTGRCPVQGLGFQIDYL